MSEPPPSDIDEDDSRDSPTSGQTQYARPLFTLTTLGDANDNRYLNSIDLVAADLAKDWSVVEGLLFKQLGPLRSQHLFWYEPLTSKGVPCKSADKKQVEKKPFDETTLEECAALVKSKGKKGYMVRITMEDCGLEP